MLILENPLLALEGESLRPKGGGPAVALEQGRPEDSGRVVDKATSQVGAIYGNVYIKLFL